MTSIKSKSRIERFVEKAYRAFFTPGQHEARPEDQVVLQSGHTRNLHWRAGELAVTTWGETGPAVLLMHGWGGSRAQMAGFVPPLLDAGFRVVAFDQPGHGESSGKLTNVLEIAAAMEIIAAEEGPFNAIVAHSFGTLATSYALNHRSFPRPERLVYLGAFNRLMDSLPRFQAVSGLPDPVIDGIRAKFYAEFGEGVLKSIVIAELVRSIEIPALMFHDTDDEVTPIEDSRAIAAAWPEVNFVETSGLKHHGALHSEEIHHRIILFLKGK